MWLSSATDDVGTTVLPDTHFSVLMRPDKRRASITALGIIGAKLMHLDRSGITWWLGAMRILALEAKSTNQSDVAFRFDTPEEIRFAWRYIIENHWIVDFSYRPESEGVNDYRAFVESYLARYRQTLVFEEIEPTVIERLIRGFFGADLFQKIIDVIEPA